MIKHTKSSQMNERIYITHCSAKKNEALSNTELKVPPDKLYTATPTRRFMNKCKTKGVTWAIFSDEYGVWFPTEKHGYYDKSPDSVTPQEFNHLVRDFDVKLSKFSEIYFYHNPGRFHPLYKRIINTVSIRDRIVPFTHIRDIE